MAKDRPAMLHGLAMAAFGQKDYPVAIDQLKRAISLRPQSALWYTQLGAMMRAAGHLDQALEAHRHAIALDARLAIAHNNLGNTLRERGDLAAAEAALREACRLKPDYAEAYGNLSRLLEQQSRFAEAEAMCRRALELKPSDIDVRGMLGALMLLRADFEGAEQCYRVVCKANRASVEGLMGLGAAFEGLGRFEEADAAYKRVVSLAPDSPKAHFALGRRFEQRGDLEAAAKHFRQALAGDPQLTNAYRILANLPKHGLLEHEKATIVEMLQQANLPDPQRSDLLYALGHSAERQGEWDQAFEWTRAANEIDHRRTNFNEAENLAFVRNTRSTFSADFRSALPTGSMSERPIFIVGMPRSGSTLIEQILSCHPSVAAGGELPDLIEMPKGLGSAIGSERPYPACVLELKPADVDQLAQRYLTRLDRVSTTAARVTDKQLFNFRHLGLIKVLFPRARVVHCRRDPRDVAVSCYFTKFHRPISFACDLFELGAYLRHYQQLMAHWRRIFPESMLELQYEDLITDPERHIRQLIEFCGLPWNEACLQFHTSARAVRTASVHQVRQPIYASSIGRWKRYAKHLVPLYAELDNRLPLNAEVVGGKAGGRGGKA